MGQLSRIRNRRLGVTPARLVGTRVAQRGVVQPNACHILERVVSRRGAKLRCVRARPVGHAPRFGGISIAIQQHISIYIQRRKISYVAIRRSSRQTTGVLRPRVRNPRARAGGIQGVVCLTIRQGVHDACPNRRGAAIGLYVGQLVRGLEVYSRPSGPPIHIAIVGAEPNRVGKVVVAVKIGNREAEAIPAPLEPGPEFHSIGVVPGIRRLHESCNAKPRDTVGPTPEGQRADQIDRVGLSAGPKICRFEIIEIERQFQTHIRERAHLVEGPDPAHAPEGDPRFLQARQCRQSKILGVELIRGSEEFGLSPHDALLADPQPKPAVKHLDIDVGLFEFPLILLARAAIEGAVDLGNIERIFPETAIGQRRAQGLAGDEQATGLVGPGRSVVPIALIPELAAHRIDGFPATRTDVRWDEVSVVIYDGREVKVGLLNDVDLALAWIVLAKDRNRAHGIGAEARAQALGGNSTLVQGIRQPGQGGVGRDEILRQPGTHDEHGVPVARATNDRDRRELEVQKGLHGDQVRSALGPVVHGGLLTGGSPGPFLATISVRVPEPRGDPTRQELLPIVGAVGIAPTAYHTPYAATHQPGIVDIPEPLGRALVDAPKAGNGLDRIGVLQWTAEPPLGAFVQRDCVSKFQRLTVPAPGTVVGN